MGEKMVVKECQGWIVWGIGGEGDSGREIVEERRGKRLVEVWEGEKRGERGVK